MTLIIILIALLALLLLAVLGIGLYAALSNFLRPIHPKVCPTALKPQMEQIKAMGEALRQMGMESHSCVSQGWRLHADFLDRHSKKIAVLLHGISTEGCSRYPDAQYYIDRGYSVLFPDFRGCGKSRGQWFGMGQYEREDMLIWAELLRARVGEDCQIVLDGVSMGAASALLLAGDGKMRNLAAVVADCGYSSARSEIIHCIKAKKFPAFIIYPAIRLWVRLLAGYDLNKSVPLDSVARAEAPILFIHGEDDDFVPCDMCRELYDACQSQKAICTVPGAVHAAARVVNRPHCEQAMDDFLSRFVQ